MKKLFLFCLILALAGCSTSDPNSGNNPPSSSNAALPTLVPEPVQTVQTQPTENSTLPVSGENGRPYSDDKLGFSFKYPETWTLLERAPDGPPGVTLGSPALGQGTEPIIFAINVDVQPANGESVKGIVDEQLAQVPKDQQGGISRRSIQVGGAAAEEVIGLPSQSGALETFVINKDQVYVIILQPYDTSNPLLAPYLDQGRNAYGLILNSWQWSR